MSDPLRDERLGAALRDLPVPEHAEGFWERLDAALEQEARKRRRPARRRRPLVRRSWRLALAVAAGAAAIAAALIGLPRGESPEPARADVVKQRLAAAVADLRTLEGRAVLRSRLPALLAESHRLPRRDRQRFRFAFAADGSFRVDDVGGASDVAYDAKAGVQRSVTTSASLGEDVSPRFYVERRQVPPGPPDDGPQPFAVEQQLGAVVRSLLAADDPRVRETTYRGRPAWRVVFREPLEPILAGTERVDVILDRQTGLPVRVRRSANARDPRLRGRSELRLLDLEVNGRLPAGAFEIDFPPDAEVERADAGFRRVGLDDAADVAGYEPLVPDAVPAGFRLSEVAAARRAPATRDGRNPPSHGVISLSYRRGFEHVTVTTRRVGNDPGRWRDPFSPPSTAEPRDRLTLSAGALQGGSAEIVVGPRSVPHLWALGGDLVVTVAGDLGRDELVRIAESL